MPEAVIIDAVRTPIGNFRGALAAVRPDDLAAVVLKSLVERTGIDPAILVRDHLCQIWQRSKIAFVITVAKTRFKTGCFYRILQ